ncbi:MAG: hypothetical protein GZ091_03640 [Paludibacter sp.]|nr:hypothetical protein [Paludibacter sp.]
MIILILFSAVPIVHSQSDDLLNMLDSITPRETLYTYGTFKSTRIVNGHSIERMPQRQLDFRVSHRFGLINQGYYQFFGLDQGSTFLSLEYGINDWVMVGLNRASLEKTASCFAKFSILRQSNGAKFMPVSMSYFVSTSLNGMKWTDPTRTNYFSSRLNYTQQLLIGRKFNEQISLQIAPTWIHRNLVPTALDNNDLFAFGMGGRYKLSRRISFNVEYYPVIRPTWNYADPQFKNCFSVGFDIETGGHVFQLLLSNSQGMIEKSFIGETTGNWFNGDMHLGFNISRVFSFKKDKDKKIITNI